VIKRQEDETARIKFAQDEADRLEEKIAEARKAAEFAVEEDDPFKR